MFLKTYLSFGAARPLWTSFADALFALKIPSSEKTVDPNVRINIFLQSWRTQVGHHQLPVLKRLTDTAQKFGLRAEGLAFSRNILRSMPIWYHREASNEVRKMNSTLASTCLKINHGVRTVGDATDIQSYCQNQEHCPTSTCECKDCKEMQLKWGCKHPHGCTRQAAKLLDTLPPKWDPRSVLPEDYQLKPKNTLQFPDSDKWKPFDNRITTSGTVAEIFRIFTDKNTEPTNLLPSLEPIPGVDKIVLATDGSCEHNGEDNAIAGAGIFVENDHPANRASKLPKYLSHSNQTGELVASKLAADTINP
ncbi:hypothetical protein GGU11DRAFT_656639, partial [Lentinula aff. detonsa]